MLKFFLVKSCDFPFWLVPRWLGDEAAAWCVYEDQVPVNLRAARKSTGST